MRRSIFVLLLLIPLSLWAKGPEQARKRIDSLLRSGLGAGYYPGASVAVGGRSGVVYSQTYGYTDMSRARRVDKEDVYDVASLTKILATTFSVMKLYDQGLIDINRDVGHYIPYYDETPVGKATISQLMTHTSGLGNLIMYTILYSNPTGENLTVRTKDSVYVHHVDRGAYMCRDVTADSTFVSFVPGEGFRQLGDTVFINPCIDTMIMRRIPETFSQPRKGRYLYSDLNFYILRQIVEKITERPFEAYTRDLFDELEMYDTGFRPLEWREKERIIPTENDYLMRRGQIHGIVHDELSGVGGGVEGSAGIFSTAEDISRFCRMMLSEGMYMGRRVLSRNTVRLFTSSPLSPRKIYRGLGFDKRDPGGESPLGRGYGHTGYTGTMIWMDRDKDVFMVFLSNRVSPSRVNNGLSSSELRTKLWEIVIEELGK